MTTKDTGTPGTCKTCEQPAKLTFDGECFRCRLRALGVKEVTQTSADGRSIVTVLEPIGPEDLS